jgi:hypothetical protein
MQATSQASTQRDPKDLLGELFSNLTLSSAPSSSTPTKTNHATIVPTSPHSVPAPLLSSPFPLRPNHSPMPNRLPLQLFPQPLGPNVVPRIALLPNSQVRLAPALFAEPSLALRLRAPHPLLAAPPVFGPSSPAARLPSPQVFAKLPRPMQVQLLMQANMQFQMMHRHQMLGARPMGAPPVLLPGMPLAAQQRLAMPPAMMPPLPLPPVPLLSNAPIFALHQRTAQRVGAENLSPRFARQLPQRTPEQREFYYMTKTERDWVIRVQLLQLHMKDPFVEDYYYLHWVKAQRNQAPQRDDRLPLKGSPATTTTTTAAAAAEGAAKESKTSASKIYGPKIDYDRRAQALLKDMTFFERKYEPKLTAGTLGRVCLSRSVPSRLASPLLLCFACMHVAHSLARRSPPCPPTRRARCST